MKTIVLMILAFQVSFVLKAQDEVVLRKKNFNLENNIALDGYDPVSYFGTSVQKGKSTVQLTYKGVIYYFSSESNLKLFKANPSKYEPAYGGWCAYAMGASGEKVEVDPHTYKIINGKLFLFYNKYFNNTLSDWNIDEVNLKKKADINWAKIYS